MATQLRAFVEISRPELGAEVTLSESDSRHAIQSLRLKNGDTIQIIDKISKKSFAATIVQAASTITARLDREIQDQNTQNRLRGIIFGLSKGDKNDLVIEKATEIGAEEIIIIQSEHSVVKIEDESNSQKKLARWARIAEAAAQQSKRNSIPKIYLLKNITELKSILDSPSFTNDSKFICTLTPSAKKLSQYSFGEHAWVAVGPEGDFSKSEIDYMTTLGFWHLSLGTNTLRAETAAIVAMGVIAST